jgi:hypothetical protein
MQAQDLNEADAKSVTTNVNKARDPIPTSLAQQLLQSHTEIDNINPCITAICSIIQKHPHLYFGRLQSPCNTSCNAFAR